MFVVRWLLLTVVVLELLLVLLGLLFDVVVGRDVIALMCFVVMNVCNLSCKVYTRVRFNVCDVGEST